MRKYFLILFFLCAGSSSALSQSPYSQRGWYHSWYRSWYRPLYQTEMDSLKKILINAKDTARINCLNELAIAYDWIKPDSEILIAKQAYREALNINYLTGVATSLLSMGMAGLAKGNFSMSESYFRQAIPFLEKVDNIFLLGQCFTYLGRGLDRQAYFEESMKCYDKAFSFFYAINDSIDIANLSMFRGDIYQNKGEYEKSFESYKTGLRIINVQSDEQEASFGYYGILLGYYNMGNLYRNVGDYQMSLRYYREGKSYTSKNHLFFYTEPEVLEAIGITFCLMQQYDSSLYYLGQVRSAHVETNMSIQLSLGETFLMQKRCKEALNRFLVQLENARKNNSRIFVMRALYDVGNAYTQTQQNNIALRYIRELLPISQETGMRQYIRDAAHLLSIIYANNKQFDSSYKYLQLYTVLKDSIESKLYLFRLARNEDEVEVEKKNAEIKLLNKDKQIQQDQISRESLIRKVLIAGIFILTLLGIIIVRVIMLKRKNEKHRHELAENELQIQKLQSEKQLAELEMRALRAQMNPHFIFNILNTIESYTLDNNKEAASGMIQKFSRLTRLVLEIQ
jgi:tetratricopeptide (TPR) repeat protein